LTSREAARRRSRKPALGRLKFASKTYLLRSKPRSKGRILAINGTNRHRTDEQSNYRQIILKAFATT
jgi:hypothetical protein